MTIHRIVKISVITFISLVILVVAGGVMLVKFVNPNTFKPLISKAVYESTGRKLAIDGNIAWKLWPNIGLQIEKLSLSNPDGYTPAKMLEVSGATVSVQLMPLLVRNVVVDSVIIDGLNIGLIKNGDLNNWTFKPTATPPSSSVKDPAGSSPPMQLKLNKFVLTHSTFSYIDAKTNKRYNIRDFGFKLETGFGGEISLNQDTQKITLEKVKFDFDSIINGQLNFVANNFDKLAYQGNIDIDKFSVIALTTKLNQPIAALNNKGLFDKVTLATAFKGDLNLITLTGFTFNLSDLVKGVLNVSVNNFNNPGYSGDIKLDELAANSVLDKMNIAVAARQNKPLLDKVAFSTKFAGNLDSVNLQQLNFNFPGILQGLTNVKVQNFSNPSYAGDIKLNEFSANLVLDKLSIAVADRKNKPLLNKVALSTKFNGNTSSINLQQFNFNFPGVLQGLTNVKVQNFSNPTYAGDIKLNEFSANSVLDKLNIAVEDRKDKPLLNKVALSTKFDGNINSINLQQFNFNFPGILQGLTNVKVQNFSNPSYAGDIKLNEFSANLVLDKLNIAVADRKNKPLLNKVVLSTNFAGNKNSVNLQPLNFNFPSALQGLVNVKVQNFAKPSYVGNIDLPTFSLNGVMAKLAMAPIDIPNKRLLDKFSLKTNFSATSNSVNLSNLLSKISDSIISGNINVSSIKPLNLAENIRISKLDVADVTDASGYKVPLTGIAANGNLSNSGDGFSNMAGVSANQNITVDNITVFGINLNNLFTEFDNAVGSTGKAVEVVNLQTIAHSARAIQAVQNMRAIAAKATSKGAKDYSEKTNLGALQSNIVMHNGIINPSSFKLSGPTIKGDGKGSVNMVDKSLSYNVGVQIVTPQKNSWLNKIIFPYHVQGKFNNLEGGADWISIQKQVVEYLVTQAVSQAKAIVNDQVNKQIDTLTKTTNPQLQQGVDAVKKGANELINNIFK